MKNYKQIKFVLLMTIVSHLVYASQKSEQPQMQSPSLSKPQAFVWTPAGYSSQTASEAINSNYNSFDNYEVDDSTDITFGFFDEQKNINDVVLNTAIQSPNDFISLAHVISPVYESKKLDFDFDPVVTTGTQSTVSELKNSQDDLNQLDASDTKIQGVFKSIDILHIQYPQFQKFNDKLKVKGGHNLDMYPAGALLPLCFKGQFNHVSNNAMVVFMAEDPSVSKTVISDFNEKMIFQLAWNPTLMYSVRKQNDYFCIYQSFQDGLFFGSFVGVNKKAKTIFPLLVVDGTEKNKSGKINIGAFCYMSQDYKTFTKPYPINVTPADFNAMMRKKPLVYADNNNTVPLLSDITDDVNKLCRKIFKDEGYKNASILQVFGYHLA